MANNSLLSNFNLISALEDDFNWYDIIKIEKAKHCLDRFHVSQLWKENEKTHRTHKPIEAHRSV